MLTLSPTLSVSALITPAAGDGISIEALSDSTVNSDCSAVTLSPALTRISVTATSLKSPMSGIFSAMVVAAAVAAGAAAAGAGAAAWGAATGAGATAGAAGAAAALSMTAITEPCLTLSPRATRSSLSTPAWLEGISIEALSDSTVSSDCSALIVSPTWTSTSITDTSSKSPMSGI
ncbi:hypothetical protein D3C78_1235210 [compost metagenome]